jgi:hypothetical protein
VAFQASNVSVTLVNVDSGRQVMPVGAANASYDFYEAFNGISSYPSTKNKGEANSPPPLSLSSAKHKLTLRGVAGGSASGDQTVVLKMSGLDLSVKYVAVFSTLDESEQLASNGSYPTSHSKISFLTPAWGTVYPARTTYITVYRVSPVDGRYGEVADVTYKASASYFLFFLVWRSVTSTSYYGAAGNDTVTVYVDGLDEAAVMGKYECVFTSEGSGDSLRVNATVESTTVLTCQTPQWGLYYSAERTEFTASTDFGAGSIISSSGTQYFDFYQARCPRRESRGLADAVAHAGVDGGRHLPGRHSRRAGERRRGPSPRRLRVLLERRRRA